MRYILYESRENFIPLEKDLRYLEDFIRLQELQMESRGEVIFSVDGQTHSKVIAPLLLIAFVENCFKHSLSSQSEDIFIRITAKIEADRPHFQCANTFSETVNSAEKHLLKPIPFERFVKAVSKVIYHPDPVVAEPPAVEKTTASPGYAFVKSDHVIIKIEFDSIRYIRSEDDFTRIFTTGKNHFLSYTLKFWLDLLPSDNFCRIHKSYIVNLQHIEKIAGNEVYVEGERLPIGRGFREDFMDRLAI